MSLGNKSFQGFGLPSDLARRLEDLARQVTLNQSNLDAAKATAVTPAQVQAIANTASQNPLNITNAIGTPGSGLGGTVLVDTHAHRPAAGKLPKGTVYVETDRLWIYAVESGGWTYIGGQAYPLTQAALAALAATLGMGDNGAIVYVSDYDHHLIWGGTGWNWAYPGDRSGFIQAFFIDPDPIEGWKLCDGSTVPYLKRDGTVGSVALPDLTGTASYLKFSNSVTASNPAVAPTISGGHVTLSGNTGSSSAGTPAGTVSGMTFSGSPVTSDQNTLPLLLSVTPGTTNYFVAGNSHTHDVTAAGTVSGGSLSGTAMPGHTHTLTGSVPVTATISDTGEPQNITLRPWFRQ